MTEIYQSKLSKCFLENLFWSLEVACNMCYQKHISLGCFEPRQDRRNLEMI